MNDLRADVRAALGPFARLVGRVPVPDLDRSSIGWAMRGYDTNALEYPYAFRMIPTINFAVSITQEALAATPLRFYMGTGDNKVEVERQALNVVDLWNNANREETGYDLMEQIVGGLQVGGASYVFKDYMGTSRVQELWCLPTHKVTPVKGKGRSAVRYDVEVGLGQYVQVPPEQIIPFRRYDPDHGITGLSPLRALMLTYGTMYDSQRYLRTFYARGGTVSGHYSTDASIDDGDIARLKLEMRTKFEGPENAWEPVILPRKLKYERAGLTLQEMQFIENNQLTEGQVLQVYKIPPLLAGHTAGAGGLNSDVARVTILMFHRFALMPLATRISATLNERFLQPGEFGPNLSCAFDFSGDPAVQAARLEQASMYQKAVGVPIMSPAEGRDEFGLPEMADRPELEELWVPVGVSPASSATADPPAPDPNAVDPSAPQSARGKRVDREALRKRAHASLSRYEGQMREAYRRLFNRQQARVIARLKAAMEGREADWQRVIDAEQLLGLADPQDRAAIRRLIRAIIQGRAAESLAELGLEVAFDMSSAAARDYLLAHVDRAIRVPNQTTATALRESLAEGQDAGEGLEQLIGRVREVFDDRRANAVTIARTETAPAYNFASLESWRQSGVVAGKSWLTAGDETVREWHREAEGQVVPLDALFNVGPDMLEFPGDPRGNPANTINCRCTIEPELEAANVTEAILPAAIRERLNGKPQTVEEFLQRNGTGSR